MDNIQSLRAEEVGLQAEEVSRRVQEIAEEQFLPVINEVLYLPNPESLNPEERTTFVEIFRPDPSWSLFNCSLQNSNESLSVQFERPIEDSPYMYLAISSDPILDNAFLLRDIRDLTLYEVDAIALFCDGDMIDFVAWSNSGVAPDSLLLDAAVGAGIWTEGAFIDTGPLVFGGGYDSPGLREGYSLGRDKDSTDTDEVADWTFPGGLHARAPTPAAQNLDHSALPVINEVLFRPKSRSRNIRNRWAFVELYRRDIGYSLNGCTILNHDGSWQFDFDDAFDSVDHSYFTIKRKPKLKKEYLLRRRKGTLWLKSMPIKQTEAIVLFCDGRMIDYVAWSHDGSELNGLLHTTAVSSGMWSSAASYAGNGTKRGQSIGRDEHSTNTHDESDWFTDRASPLAKNRAQSPPLINEVLFFPNPESDNEAERQAFVEIYIADKRQRLGGCRLENDDGSFNLELGEDLDSINTNYLVVRHEPSLDEPFVLQTGQGVLLARDLSLEAIDGLALSCEDEMLDYGEFPSVYASFSDRFPLIYFCLF